MFNRKVKKSILVLLGCLSILTLIFISFSTGEDEKAKEKGVPSVTPTETPAISPTETPSEAPTFSEISSETLSDDLEYLEEQKLIVLKEREAILEKREMELDEKEKQLNALKSELDTQRKEILKIQNDIKKMMETITTESSKKIGELAKIYESMKPDNAASVLVELYKTDKETTIEVIKVLQPRKSGKIMDAMANINKEIAANISFEISKRQNVKF